MVFSRHRRNFAGAGETTDQLLAGFVRFRRCAVRCSEIETLSIAHRFADALRISAESRKEFGCGGRARTYDHRINNRDFPVRTAGYGTRSMIYGRSGTVRQGPERTTAGKIETY